jgi:hypothetical protein
VPKNPVAQVIIFSIVVIWGIYQLVAPGEAQNRIVVIMEWFAIIGGSLGLIGAIVQLASGKRPGSEGKRS